MGGMCWGLGGGAEGQQPVGEVNWRPVTCGGVFQKLMVVGLLFLTLCML